MDDPPFNTILSAAGLYSLLVSALYLFGYWGAFGLNIFELISLGDLLGHALFPFFAGLVSLFMGFAVSHLAVSPIFPPGAGRGTHIARFLERWGRYLIVLDLLSMIVIAVFGREPTKWVAVALLIVPFSGPLSSNDYIARRIPSPTVRQALVGVLLALASSAFAQGRLDAYRLQHEGGGQLVDLVKSGLQLPVDQRHPVSYVGHFGDFFILYESAKSQVVLLRADKITALVLTANPSRQ